MKYPAAINKLMQSFQMYPGIGNKTAERLAFFTYFNLEDDDIIRFSENLLKLKQSVRLCSLCGGLSDYETCQICSDPERENIILVVEGSKDVVMFENIKQYNGKYHILNGLISPLKGVEPTDINIKSLFRRIKNENPSELIIATAATVEGEMTALYINEYLKESNVKVSRIAYGLPAGGNIEFANEVTLIRSLEGRHKI